MRLGFLVLMDSAEVFAGKLYALGAGWNMLRMPELPHEWSFNVGIGLDVPWDETNRRYAMEMRVDDPDGQPLDEPFTTDVEIGRPPGTLRGQDQRIVFTVAIRTTFEKVGPHAVVISADGEEIDRSRFYVVQVGG